MAITRATNLAGLGTVFDALTDGGGLSISGLSTFSAPFHVGFGGTVINVGAGYSVGIGTTDPAAGLQVSAPARGIRVTSSDIDFGNGQECAFMDYANVARFGHLSGSGGGTKAVQIINGNTTKLEITADGHARPGVDNGYDLGQANYRWRNIYSADLQLSNEGSCNDVDGTWGKYTIQEGESDLFLINRRTGKKYRFLLEEVE